MTASHRRIDLNADVGEGVATDAVLIPLVSSANVCAGAHAGDAALMAETVRLAVRHGVAVGAHPGHPDRGHFGRRPLPISPAAAAVLVDEQIAAVAAHAGGNLHHVKLHGGLYHQVGGDPALAEAVAGILAARWPWLVVYAASGSVLARVAREGGLAVAHEAFIDRGYRVDGTLVPRGEAGAAIDDPAAAAARAVRMVTEGVVQTAAGSDLAIDADTLCIHGDGPRAVEIAAAVREALTAAGVAIRRPTARAHPT
ncbi:MAG: 5-oxoprolinase subunit PxpA [Planctomycetaceae bacterium]